MIRHLPRLLLRAIDLSALTPLLTLRAERDAARDEAERLRRYQYEIVAKCRRVDAERDAYAADARAYLAQREDARRELAEARADVIRLTAERDALVAQLDEVGGDRTEAWLDRDAARAAAARWKALAKRLRRVVALERAYRLADVATMRDERDDWKQRARVWATAEAAIEDVAAERDAALSEASSLRSQLAAARAAVAGA
jgi:chromosome segregation ATPase